MMSSQKTIRKLSEDSVRRNSISGDRPLRVSAFTREGIFLSFKLYTKSQEQIKHKENLAIGIYDKYKILNGDQRKRLHIDTPYNDVHAIKDVDVDYFSCGSGRPFFHYAPPFKSHKYLFSKQLKLSQELGYIKDIILKIIENHRKEEKTYEVAVKRYLEQLRYFDNFISDDYHNSMKCLIKCDELVIYINKKIEELQRLANEKFTMSSRLIGLNYMYGHHQKYGRFLYYLSPPLWRLKNREFARSVEIEAKGFDFGMFSEEDTFNVIFENMKKECVGDLIRPALYFNRPCDLMKTFDGIEKQQLHHFTHVVHMVPCTRSLKDRIKILKDGIVLDTSGVTNNIKSFEKLLTFYEDLCAQLEAKFFRLIYGSFYDNEGASKVLKLKLHLEFCYEKVYLDIPNNMDIVSMARALENFYMEYNKRIEAIHIGKIKAAVLYNFQLERNKSRRAKVAARELQLFGRLEQALQRAYEPVVENQLAALAADKLISKRKTFRKVNSQGNVEKTRLPVLTEAEREYLTLFTDWNDNEDPANYLQSLNISQKEMVFL